MKTALILASMPLVGALVGLVGALISEFGPAGRRRRAEIDHMGRETDAAWVAMMQRWDDQKGAPCDECGLDYGYHRPWCRTWPTGLTDQTAPGPLAELEPWRPA